MSRPRETLGATDLEIGDACIVCWQTPTDRAHLIDRSLVPDPQNHPLRVVRLCRAHHGAYDDHRLDLLPFLEPRHRRELAYAVEIFGLVGTLERVTGLGLRRSQRLGVATLRPTQMLAQGET